MAGGANRRLSLTLTLSLCLRARPEGRLERSSSGPMDTPYCPRDRRSATYRPVKDWTKISPAALNAQIVAERLTDRAEAFELLNAKSCRIHKPLTLSAWTRQQPAVHATRSPCTAHTTGWHRPTPRLPPVGSLGTGETGGGGTLRRR